MSKEKLTLPKPELRNPGPRGSEKATDVPEVQADDFKTQTAPEQPKAEQPKSDRVKLRVKTMGRQSACSAFFPKDGKRYKVGEIYETDREEALFLIRSGKVEVVFDGGELPDAVLPQ